MKRVFQIFVVSFLLIVTGAVSGVAASIEERGDWQKQEKPPERPKEREKPPKEDKRPDPPKGDKKKPDEG